MGTSDREVLKMQLCNGGDYQKWFYDHVSETFNLRFIYCLTDQHDSLSYQTANFVTYDINISIEAMKRAFDQYSPKRFSKKC